MMADILLKVYARDPDLYKILRVTVYRESAPSEQIYTAKLDMQKLTPDNNNGILLQIPSVAVDGKVYSVQIEPTLGQGNRDKTQTKYFVSNTTFNYVEIEYVVKAAAPEQHMKQTSVWTLIGLFTVVFAIYNTERVFAFIRQKVNVPVATVAPSARQKQPPAEIVDNNDIDLIVQSIYAVKRRPKPKKI